MTAAYPAAAPLLDDIAFARSIDKTSIPFWSTDWHRIGGLQRRGLVKIIPITRWIAVAEAIGAAKVP